MFDVLALGGINLDLVLEIARLPEAGEKVSARFLGRYPGGPVGNFACAASRLGSSVASIAVIGDDEDGQQVLRSFEDFIVNTTFLVKSQEKCTPFTIIAIEPSGERVILVPDFDDRVPLEQVAAALPFARSLYIMPRDVAYFMRVAQSAYNQGVQVMVDIEPTLPIQKRDLEKMAPLIEILSFNEKGFQKIFAQNPDAKLLQALLLWGPKVVVVTLGKRGAIGADSKNIVLQEGFRVSTADTTGAGDTFNAAFFTAFTEGRPLRASLQFACAAAALSTMGIGARGHLPTREEVFVFLKEYSENIA